MGLFVEILKNIKEPIPQKDSGFYVFIQDPKKKRDAIFSWVETFNEAFPILSNFANSGFIVAVEPCVPNPREVLNEKNKQKELEKMGS